MARECGQILVPSPVPSPPVPSVPPVPVPVPVSKPPSAPVPLSAPSSPVPATNFKSPAPSGLSVNDEKWDTIKILLDRELSKIPETEYIDYRSFIENPATSYPIPCCYHSYMFQVVRTFDLARRCR